jgi:xanthine dehydrogenase accessory factor
MMEDIYEKIVSLRSQGIRFVLATVIAREGMTPPRGAAKMLIDETGGFFGTIGGGIVEAEVVREAKKIIHSGSSKILAIDLTRNDPEENIFVCGGHMEVYLEPMTPNPTLYIFGTGNVGKALADVAAFAGFRIVVVDDRGKYANAERFPRADDFYVDSYENTLKKLKMNNDSYIFISTREHHIDELCLKFAMESSARYIGMLGNRKKVKLLEEYLEGEGMGLSQLRRVSVPIGFDIGAETPEEIAISIAAELVAARKNRDVVLLKNAVHTAGLDHP